MVSLKGKKNVYGPELENAPVDLVYIGRNMYMGGWKLKKSLFYNPYTIGKSKTRDEVIEEYENYVRNKLSNDKEFALEFRKLQGKTLACWCYPERCHGDVIVGILKETN